MTSEDAQVIRGLAKTVAEIAADPIHDQKRELWTRLNGLEPQFEGDYLCWICLLDCTN